MKVTEIDINKLKAYEKNPRKNDNAVKEVANSIKEFGWKVPVVIDKDYVILAGHTRVKAANMLGLKKVPCIIADDLNEQQAKAFRLADNKTGELANWDFDLLIEELAGLYNFDMSDFGFDIASVQAEASEKPYEDAINDQSLQERFGAPPFSVLDTRQKYWRKRKEEWLLYIGYSGTGRGQDLLSGGGLEALNKAMGNSISGTSVFDPVLCEIMYKWFNVAGGAVIDPFAGGCVRGLVAQWLGYQYLGIDLSDYQVETNREKANELGVVVNWICDDSLNIDKYADNGTKDMIFSCPPYYDLEKYSADPKDLSNMDYPDFLSTYEEIIKKACNKLKDNRFAVWVVGDVRDKKGFCRDFIGDTKKAFFDAGLKLYNEFVLVEMLGTAPIRAGAQFRASRKVVKTHQNVLVFYKGDPKRIKSEFPDVGESIGDESEMD